MINISDLVKKAKEEGYNEEQARAKIGQEIILFLLSRSGFCDNLTIKGGVLMRDLSKKVRRATLDLDMDLIKYPLNETTINSLVFKLNQNDELKISLIGTLDKLKHHQYEGLRGNLEIKDCHGYTLNCKIDIGVHKYVEIEQSSYCFDISVANGGVTLLANTKEQMFAEKLKSLLRMGPFTTRFKDVYDLYFLSKIVDSKRLYRCIRILIFDDKKARENDFKEILNRVENIFGNPQFLFNLSTSDRNWVKVDNNSVLKAIIQFLKKQCRNNQRN